MCVGKDVNNPEVLKTIHAKVETKIKSVIDDLRASHGKFEDKDFGPTEVDPYGAKSLYGAIAPDPAGHSKYPAPDTLRWDRPIYEDKNFSNGDGEEGKAAGGDEGEEEEDEFDEFAPVEEEPESFCTHGRLFIDGSSSGDVVQGQLGDCWFLGALAVLATNETLLKNCFYRLDDFQEFGLFICVFYKDCQLIYVIIDDRIPVVARTNKIVFAKCKDPNELWVPLIEKAYAKLFGCYKALIGGYSHFGLADMTGYSPRLVGLKPGYMGYSNDITDASLWQLLSKYKRWNSLMACSIQSNPKQGHKVEADAGGGLYMGHAYSLLDVNTLILPTTETTKKLNGAVVRLGADGKEEVAVALVKLRNPWGRGEWSMAWSDDSEEMHTYEDELQACFNAALRDAEKMKMGTTNDGTFLMSFVDWRARYTSLFVAINFPTMDYGTGGVTNNSRRSSKVALNTTAISPRVPEPVWTGQSIKGRWDGEVGGNRDMGTWISNPKIKLRLDPDLNKSGYAEVFVGLYINDSRLTMGFDYFKDPLYTNPLAFDLVTEKEFEAMSKDRALIPGSATDQVSGAAAEVTPSVQPPYMFGTTQIEIFLKTGTDYYIVPSLYKRNQPGVYYLSVYSDTTIELEGGSNTGRSIDQKPMVLGGGTPSGDQEAPPQAIAMTRAQYFEKKELLREKIVSEAKRLKVTYSTLESTFNDYTSAAGGSAGGGGDSGPTAPNSPVRGAKVSFATSPSKATSGPVVDDTGGLTKAAFKRRLMDIGFNLADFPDDDLIVLDADNSGTISPQEFLDFFKQGCQFVDSSTLHNMGGGVPVAPVDDLMYQSIDLEGVLTVKVKSVNDLRTPVTWFDSAPKGPGSSHELPAPPGDSGASGAKPPAPPGAAVSPAPAVSNERKLLSIDPAALASVTAQCRSQLAASGLSVGAPAAGGTGGRLGTIVEAPPPEPRSSTTNAAPTATTATATVTDNSEEPGMQTVDFIKAVLSGKFSESTKIGLLSPEAEHTAASGLASLTEKNLTAALGGASSTLKREGSVKSVGSTARQGILLKKGMEAAAKLHSDKILQSAEIGRTSALSLLKAQRKTQLGQEDKPERAVIVNEGTVLRRKVSQPKKQMPFAGSGGRVSVLHDPAMMHYLGIGCRNELGVMSEAEMAVLFDQCLGTKPQVPVLATISTTGGGSTVAVELSSTSSAPNPSNPTTIAAGTAGTVDSSSSIASTKTLTVKAASSSSVVKEMDLFDEIIDSVVCICSSKNQKEVAQMRRLKAAMARGKVNKRDVMGDTSHRAVHTGPRGTGCGTPRGSGTAATPRNLRKSPGSANVSISAAVASASHSAKGKITPGGRAAAAGAIGAVPENIMFDEVYRKLVCLPVIDLDLISGNASNVITTTLNPMNASTSLLSKTEALSESAMSRSLAAPSARLDEMSLLRNAFLKYDHDLNGSITEAEFQVTLRECFNIDMSPDEVSTLFNRLCTVGGPDDSHSEAQRELSWTEFTNFYASFSDQLTNLVTNVSAGPPPSKKHLQIVDVIQTIKAKLQPYIIGHINVKAKTEKAIGAASGDANGTKSDSLVEDNVFFDLLTLDYAKDNCFLLKTKIGVDISVVDMKRVSRIFKFDLNLFMKFIMSTGSEAEGPEIRLPADAPVQDQLPFSKRVQHLKYRIITAIHQRFSTSWSPLTPTSAGGLTGGFATAAAASPRSTAEDAPAIKPGSTAPMPVGVDTDKEEVFSLVPDMTVTDVRKVWKALAVHLRAPCNYDTLCNFFCKQLLPEYQSTLSQKQGLVVESDNHTLSSIPVVSPKSSTISSVDEICARTVIDTLLYNSWNPTTQYTDEVGQPYTPELTDCFYISGLDALLRSFHIEDIENKLKYCIKLEHQLNKSHIYALLHVYVSAQTQECLTVIHDPLSNCLLSCCFTQPDIVSLPSVQYRMGQGDIFSVGTAKLSDVPLMYEYEQSVLNQYIARLRLLRTSAGHQVHQSARNYDIFKSPCYDTIFVAENQKFLDTLKRLVLIATTSTAGGVSGGADGAGSAVVKAKKPTDVLPFFCIVNDLCINFLVDSESIANIGRGSIQKLVFSKVRAHTGLTNFLVNSKSDMTVNLSSYNSAERVSMKWLEMVSYLTGHRNPFFTVQLLPANIPVEKYHYVVETNSNQTFTGDDADSGDEDEGEGPIVAGATNEDLALIDLREKHIPKRSSASQKGRVDHFGGTHPSWRYTAPNTVEGLAKTTPGATDPSLLLDTPLKFTYQPPKLSNCKVLFNEIAKVRVDGLVKYLIIMVREGVAKVASPDTPATPRSGSTGGGVVKKNRTFIFLTAYDSRTAAEYQCGCKPGTVLDAILTNKPLPTVGKGAAAVAAASTKVKPATEYTTEQLAVFIEQAADNDELIIGPSITPRIVINLYNDDLSGKSDELLGSCQISISSLLSSGCSVREVNSRLTYSVTSNTSADSGACAGAGADKSGDSDPNKETLVRAGELSVELGFQSVKSILAEAQSKEDYKNRRNNPATSRPGSRKSSKANVLALKAPEPNDQLVARSEGVAGGDDQTAAVEALRREKQALEEQLTSLKTTGGQGSKSEAEGKVGALEKQLAAVFAEKEALNQKLSTLAKGTGDAGSGAGDEDETIKARAQIAALQLQVEEQRRLEQEQQKQSEQQSAARKALEETVQLQAKELAAAKAAQDTASKGASVTPPASTPASGASALLGKAPAELWDQLLSLLTERCKRKIRASKAEVTSALVLTPLLKLIAVNSEAVGSGSVLSEDGWLTTLADLGVDLTDEQAATMFTTFPGGVGAGALVPLAKGVEHVEGLMAQFVGAHPEAQVQLAPAAAQSDSVSLNKTHSGSSELDTKVRVPDRFAATTAVAGSQAAAPMSVATEGSTLSATSSASALHTPQAPVHPNTGSQPHARHPPKVDWETVPLPNDLMPGTHDPVWNRRKDAKTGRVGSNEFVFVFVFGYICLSHLFVDFLCALYCIVDLLFKQLKPNHSVEASSGYHLECTPQEQNP